nr:MAG TPA: hypothetical protein [Caudoviricetes sp.]
MINTDKMREVIYWKRTIKQVTRTKITEKG